ncbi:MAG: rpoE [Burkholderia sp.]|jgi:RNA polymerase sigma-70 factor (ECF subfamily)|nr:rpoE [Burkholderia sp.]
MAAISLVAAQAGQGVCSFHPCVARQSKRTGVCRFIGCLQNHCCAECGRKNNRLIGVCVELILLHSVNILPRACCKTTRIWGLTTERDIDQLLVERVQRGDKRAFELLVSKYQRKLMRLVSRLVRDQAEAEDVVQEAFIKAYRALPQFRGDSAFYTWLYRIGINTAKNYLVTQGRRAPTSTEADAEEAETFDDGEHLRDINTPESMLATKQIAETVNVAMDALPEELRMAITLREIEGLSYDEIAEAMGCPIGTVRSRIFRAREAIAEKLRPLLGTALDKRW